MGLKDNAKALIDANVYANGQEQITGHRLNATLKGMVDILPTTEEIVSGIKGVATTSTVPSATGFERYIVHEAGTYTNFGGIVVTAADLDVVNGVANNRVILEVNNGVATMRVERVKGDAGPAADMTGVNKVLEKFPLKSFINGGNFNPKVDLTFADNPTYPVTYPATTNTYLNSLGVTKIGTRTKNASGNVELNIAFSASKIAEYQAKNGKYIKVKWHIFSKNGLLPTLTTDRFSVIGISDAVTYANGKLTYTTVNPQVFEVTAIWKITQLTLPSYIYLSTNWESANIPVYDVGDLGVSGVGVWYADTLAELESVLKYDWQTPATEVLTRAENDALFAKNSDLYGGTLNKYANIPYIHTAIAPFFLKHKWKTVDSFNQLNLVLAGDSILGRQTATEMAMTPDVNGGVGNGYDTGHFPPNMYNKNIAWYVLNMLQFADSDVKYYNLTASEVVKTGTWNVTVAGADSIRVATSAVAGSHLTLPIPTGHTHVKFIHSNYSVGLGKGSILKAEFSTDGGSTWVTPESLGLTSSYANNGTNGNYLTPTGTLGTYKWGNIIWKGLNPATSYQVRVTLVSGTLMPWGFETWSKPRVNVLVTAEGGNTASEQKTYPQRFYSQMYNSDLIIYELPYLNDLGTGVIANFKGKAILATTPSGSPVLNDFWYATVAGTYTNFGGLVAKVGDYIEWNGSAWVIGTTSLTTAINNYINNNTIVFERLRMQGVPVLCLIPHDDTLNLTRPFSTDLGLMMMRLMAKKYGFAYLDVNYYQKIKGITSFMSDGTHLNDTGVKMYNDALSEVFVPNQTFASLSYPQMNNKILKGNSASNTVAFGMEFKEIPTVRLYNNHSQIVSAVTRSGFTTTGSGSFDWEAQII